MTARAILAAQLAAFLCLSAPSSRAATRATHDLGGGCVVNVRLVPEVPEDGRVAMDRCSCGDAHGLDMASTCCDDDIRLVAAPPEQSEDGPDLVVHYPYALFLGDTFVVSNSLSVTCVPPASGGCSSGQCPSGANAGAAAIRVGDPHLPLAMPPSHHPPFVAV